MAGQGGYRATGLGWPGAMASAGATPWQPDEQARTDELFLEAGLGFRLGRAHRLLRAAWEGVIADLALSPPQAAVLQVVAQHPGSGLRELARRMRTDAMNAKRLADHLERAGLILSAADPGHRQRRVLRPTQRGAALAAELGRRATRHQRALARLLSPGEVASLEVLLDHLEQALATAGGTGAAADGTAAATGSAAADTGSG